MNFFINSVDQDFFINYFIPIIVLSSQLGDVVYLSNEIIQSQISIATTDGNASGTDGTVSYIVGQVVYKFRITK